MHVEFTTILLPREGDAIWLIEIVAGERRVLIETYCSVSVGENAIIALNSANKLAIILGLEVRQEIVTEKTL